jgi:hypothetical protein
VQKKYLDIIVFVVAGGYRIFRIMSFDGLKDIPTPDFSTLGFSTMNSSTPYEVEKFVVEWSGVQKSVGFK